MRGNCAATGRDDDYRDVLEIEEEKIWLGRVDCGTYLKSEVQLCSGPYVFEGELC